MSMKLSVADGHLCNMEMMIEEMESKLRNSLDQGKTQSYMQCGTMSVKNLVGRLGVHDKTDHTLFQSDLTRKWALAADNDGVDDIVHEKYGISKEKWAQFCQTCRDPLWENKSSWLRRQRKDWRKLPSPEALKVSLTLHVKWKMACTKKTGQMTSKAAKEIVEKIASQGSFAPHGRQDVLAATIGQPEHPGCGLALPPEPEVGPSGARVITKESCVDPSGNDPETSDSEKCGMYIEENPSRLVALGRLYEGSTTVHNIPLLHGQVKVGVEEVTDAETPILVPTDEVAAKPPERPDPEVDDPLYLMALTIPQLFLKSLQVMWDATVFGVFNQNFSLYIKHEDLSEITHGGQCLSISIIHALKGLDDTPQPKSKAGARLIVVKYFNDVRPLEAERLKALRIQWTEYYLKVRNQSQDVRELFHIRLLN
ncbi:putative F-actin-capping protein subunit beta [Glycine max]|nr:putative F-actin-capping protein subunit beta [Glycine max]